MSQMIPNRFLFKFEFSIHRCAERPAIDGAVEGWDARYLLPPLHKTDGEQGFGDVYAAWDEEGIYVACRVAGKSTLPHCDASQFWKSDNLRLMIDLRDTRNIRRATRFCRQIYLLPVGGGKNGKAPVAGSAPIHSATESSPTIPAGRIPIASIVTKRGYTLTAHLPTSLLAGFDPAENPRIGFFYMLEDSELGQQSLTIGDDLNWWIDPSTWPTAVLTR